MKPKAADNTREKPGKTVSVKPDPVFQRFCKKYKLSFNPQQEAAIEQTNGTVLLLAVPGSGKTTTLIGRLGYMTLCQGIDPHGILAITYTRAGAEHMKEVFNARFDSKIGDAISFMTINAFCSRLIFRAGVQRTLCDEKEKRRLIRQLFASINDEKYPQEADIISADNAIGYVKNMMLSEEEIRKTDWDIDHFPEIYAEYCKRLKASGRIDFDDQMRIALYLLEKNPQLAEQYRNRYPYICLDEAQDTSRLQHAILNLLCGKENHLFLVGDEDQSIYGYRGAFPQALLHIQNQYPNAAVLKLETNYRSRMEIVEAASRFIKGNRNRIEKTMTSSRGEGGAVEILKVRNRNGQYAKVLECCKAKPEGIAVLYRNNDSVLPLIDLFDRNKVPFILRRENNTFFTNRVVCDIKDFFRFAINHNDSSLLKEIYYKFSMGFTKERIESTIRFSTWKHTDLLEEFEEQSTYYKGTPSSRKRMKENAEEFADTFRTLGHEKPAEAIVTLERLGYTGYAKDKGFNLRTLDLLKSIAHHTKTLQEFLTRLEQLETLMKEGGSGKGVVLSTIHSAKGLEYDHVILIDAIEGILPSRNSLESKTKEQSGIFGDYEEERRLFYVAVTRARDKLTLLSPEEEFCNFVDEIVRKEEPPELGKPEKPLTKPPGKKKARKSISEKKPESAKPGKMVLDANLFQRETKPAEEVKVDLEKIRHMLERDNPVAQSLERNKLKLISGYRSEGSIDEYLLALRKAGVFACGEGFLILSVRNEKTASDINRLAGDAEVRGFINTIFGEGTEVIALSDAEVIKLT